jgi:hypothetical protein
MVLIAGAGASARLAASRQEEPVKQESTSAPVQPPIPLSQRNATSQRLSVETETQPQALVLPEAAPPAEDQALCIAGTSLAASTDSTLVRLAPYEKALCGSGTFVATIIRISLPLTNDEADRLSADLTKKLAATATAKLMPYVVVDALSNDEKSGSVFEYFLGTLKAQGIDERIIGTWVFFPSPNAAGMPLDPAVFATNYSSYSALYKEYFTAGRLGVMFDATDAAEMYLSALPVGLVSSVGYRGIPTTDLSAILKKYAVTSVWFNLAFPNQETDAVPLLTSLRNSGVRITVNIQADDESFKKNAASFTDFAKKLQEQSIDVGIY